MKQYRIIRNQYRGDIYNGDAVSIAYWVYHNWLPSRGINIVDINNVDHSGNFISWEKDLDWFGAGYKKKKKRKGYKKPKIKTKKRRQPNKNNN